MLIDTGVAAQIADTVEDDVRVLICGTGVAGLALAQLLRHRGLHPVLIEHGTRESLEGGYMLGLMPFVDPVISALGVEAPYLDGSVGVHRYRLRGHTGRLVSDYSLDRAFADFGRYRGIERGRLLEVIADAPAPVSFETKVTALHQEVASVRACLDGADTRLEADFDAVIIAEGTHSATRDFLWSPEQVHSYDTGWGGWVAWADADADDLYEETWGAGFLVGTYPVPGRTGVFVGGPRSATSEGPGPFVEGIWSRLHTVTDRTERALDAVAGAHQPFYWTFTDVRSETWTAGRVGLLGDAAAGFLPTAGVGAAMALESASALASGLATASRSGVTEALDAYERTQRPRVEAAQTNSRQLARLMFRRNRLLTGARDLATPFTGVDTALGPILRLLREREPAGYQR